MFETFALWLHNDAFRLAYALILAAVLGLPMIFIARWYHGNIRQTEGGRRLMERQNAGRVGPRSLRGVDDGIGLARDISAGRYGDHAKRTQGRVYVYVLAWMIAVLVVAGLMIAAQHFYPKPGLGGLPAPAIPLRAA
jgi:hypothetical protein